MVCGLVLRCPAEQGTEPRPRCLWFNADGVWYRDTARTPEAGERLMALGWPRIWLGFDAVVSRCDETATAALADRVRRLCQRDISGLAGAVQLA